ncbi:uncharacterized protein [Drosophila suzukii]|uniref:Uncharacterized protein isoform X1 n=1 Tax=Drosophila suzukii TaxID=28584 RepID=A0AB40DL25_DROSZ
MTANFQSYRCDLGPPSYPDQVLDSSNPCSCTKVHPCIILGHFLVVVVVLLVVSVVHLSLWWPFALSQAGRKGGERSRVAGSLTGIGLPYPATQFTESPGLQVSGFLNCRVVSLAALAKGV